MQALPLPDAGKPFDPFAPDEDLPGPLPDELRPEPEHHLPVPIGRRTSALTRMALSRARMRSVAALDAVTFVGACPACGRDSEWTQTRQETRVRSEIACTCASWPTPPTSTGPADASAGPVAYRRPR